MKTKKEDNFSVVSIKRTDINFAGLIDYVEEVARHEFSCDGIESVNYDESKVNEILKEKAVGGGEIPLEILEEVERHASSDESSQSTFYFYGKKHLERSKKFYQFLKDNISINVSLKILKDKDWNSEWRKSFSPIEVSENVKILPEWYLKTRPYDNQALYIYPGMGFGTGGHETTFLCLALLDKFFTNKGSINQQKSCLDFGCGSGILGIASMKYCNIITDFCDVDKMALDNCVQNININFSEEDINEFCHGTGKEIRIFSRDKIDKSKKYDLIFANILANILKEESDIIYSMLESNGSLILSGILLDEIDDVLNFYLNKFNDLKLKERATKGDWGALVLVKK